MTKNRDWIDYANLASNISQNVQLRDMQHKLGAVASVMQEEKNTTEREHRLREAVFQAESMLRTLQKSAQENPSASLAWTRTNLLQFQRNDLTSASFRSYEDKERLRSVVEGHEQYLQECAARLTAQQRDQASLCGQYLVDRDDLNLLIRLAGQHEKLEQLIAELAPLSAKDNSFVLLQGSGVLCIFGGLALLANELRIPGWGIIGTGLLFCLLSFAVSPKHQHKSQLEKEIAKFIGDEPLLDPTRNVVGKLRKSFGSLRYPELIKMRAEREALIVVVLGEADPSTENLKAMTQDNAIRSEPARRRKSSTSGGWW
jgi:hypothetical protein